MIGSYVLVDGRIRREPDIVKWADWFATADRSIDRTAVGDEVSVSTVFLGIDHGFGASAKAILFETLIFGGPYDGYMWRASTMAEAKAIHWQVVDALRRGVTPEPDTDIVVIWTALKQAGLSLETIFDLLMRPDIEGEEEQPHPPEESDP